MSRILLVEDDLGHRSLMEDRLRKTGFDVLGCGSIADARQWFSSAGWDAVLLDQRLPDGEGLDLMAHLRRASPGLPIILVTALGGEDVAVRALRSGVDDYLTRTERLTSDTGETAGMASRDGLSFWLIVV